MELKNIEIDGEEIEIALKLDEEYFENNINLENTLELKLKVKDDDNTNEQE